MRFFFEEIIMLDAVDEKGLQLTKFFYLVNDWRWQFFFLIEMLELRGA